MFFRFTFDFMREAGAQRVFFRLQPKLKNGVIVRNAELDGKWGDEEKSLCGGFPFANGEEFKVRNPLIPLLSMIYLLKCICDHSCHSDALWQN